MTHNYDAGSVALSGDRFTVEQTGRDGNLQPEYEARDVTGDVIFRCTYEMYEGRDELVFVDADGFALFSVIAAGTVDIAGEYHLRDGHSDEDVVVLDNDVSLLQDTWRIRDADDGSPLVEISSRGTLVTLARTLLPGGKWIPHNYEITDAQGERVGAIEGEFAILEEYDITIDAPAAVPLVAIVAGTAVIDAIQGH